MPNLIKFARDLFTIIKTKHLQIEYACSAAIPNKNVVVVAIKCHFRDSVTRFGAIRISCVSVSFSFT